MSRRHARIIPWSEPELPRLRTAVVPQAPATAVLFRLLVLIGLTGWAGCGRKSPDGAERLASAALRGTPSRGLMLLVAASTRDAVEELVTAYRQAHAFDITIVAGGSSTLATQIIAGAPADLFLSASTRWAEELESRGYAAEVHSFLSNDVVLVVPLGNPAQVNTPADLLSDAVTRVALAGAEVPAGIYARQSLRAAGVYDRLEAAHRIARGAHVRVALGYVERGEAEAGVVYATDAKLSDEVEVVYAFDDNAHEPITYPLVLLRGATDNPQARALFSHLTGQQAASVFARHGFSTLRP